VLSAMRTALTNTNRLNFPPAAGLEIRCMANSLACGRPVDRRGQRLADGIMRRLGNASDYLPRKVPFQTAATLSLEMSEPEILPEPGRERMFWRRGESAVSQGDRIVPDRLS
jgi:hypothetical protein